MGIGGKMEKIIISDVDGTLAESRQPIDAEIAPLIANVLKTRLFCTISGGSIELLIKQLTPLIELSDFKEENFFISATSGAVLYRMENKSPRLIYKECLTIEEKNKIEKLILALSKEFWLNPASKEAGPLIEDRQTQITLSCLGHKAPNDLKEKWDPTGARRTAMIDWIYTDRKKEVLDAYGISIKMGGTTSLDFTRTGINKKFGIEKLLSHLKIDPHDAIFFGDNTTKLGNDYIEDYVKTVQTNIPKMKEYLKNGTI